MWCVGGGGGGNMITKSEIANLYIPLHEHLALLGYDKLVLEDLFPVT
jgi:hypothetical protein